MKMRIEIVLSAPRMESPYEIIQALENALASDLWNIFRKDEAGKIFDSNGVLVGTWRVDES